MMVSPPIMIEIMTHDSFSMNKIDHIDKVSVFDIKNSTPTPKWSCYVRSNIPLLVESPTRKGGFDPT